MILTYRVEKTTSTDIPVLINKTFFYLKELNYCITSNTNNIIAFEFGGGLRLVPRGQNMNRIDKGIIEFNNFKSENAIKLTYSISITFQLIIVSALLIIGIFEGPIMFIGIVSLLVFTISFFITKTKAKEMITEIINKAKDNTIKE